MKKLMMIAGVAVTLVGCVTPKVMVSNNYLADTKVASKLKRIEDAKENTYKWYMKVCDLGKGGATSNCRDTEIGHNANN
jgi:hypothetical protein